MSTGRASDPKVAGMLGLPPRMQVLKSAGGRPLSFAIVMANCLKLAQFEAHENSEKTICRQNG